MLRKSLPWFRMYHEFATDPKVQSMPEIMQRRLVMLFCLKCSGDLDKCNADETAFALHVTKKELEETLNLLHQKGFVDEKGQIRNWNKRQFISDSSTVRVQRHRERLKHE